MLYIRWLFKGVDVDGKTHNCIDAGSRYCPCNLVNTMDCISCSHLRRKFCDCNWNGVCILYEYYMNNEQCSDFRRTYNGVVIDKVLDKNLILLKTELDKELLNELNVIGSYVFVKKRIILIIMRCLCPFLM